MDDEHVSAFAVYSTGAIDRSAMSKKQIKRRELKERLKTKITENGVVGKKRKSSPPEIESKPMKKSKRRRRKEHREKSEEEIMVIRKAVLIDNNDKSREKTVNGLPKRTRKKKSNDFKIGTDEDNGATSPEQAPPAEPIEREITEERKEEKDVPEMSGTKSREKVSQLSGSSHFLNRKQKFKSPLQKMKHMMLVAEARQVAKSEIGSDRIGKETLEKLIHPHRADDFVRDYWEKKPLYIPAKKKSQFADLITSSAIDEILRFNVVMFGKHVDVTSYADGVRETLNPEGRAQAHVLWDYYQNGCSVRLLNPQYFLPDIHALLATLQEYFGCMVGVNSYLTPPDSQGFAPHYDDIEAFVYQAEGRKRWKIYKPRCRDEVLPRFSSPNFTEEEIGEPILEVVLSPGDVLYFPRGFIHQAKTVPGEHSLHLTFSTYQKTSWCDLLEKALPKMLERACREDVEFRRGLPLGYLHQAGLAHPRSYGRKELVQRFKSLVNKLENYVDIDSAVDLMGVQFMHDAVPPVFTADEMSCSVYKGGLRMAAGRLRNNVQLCDSTRIRLMRANCCRLVEEAEAPPDDRIRLYYTVDNSCEYHGEEPQYVILPVEMVPAVHFLIGAYPGFVSVTDLPCSSRQEKVALASDLWDRGFLMTDVPLREQQQQQPTSPQNQPVANGNRRLVKDRPTNCSDDDA